MVLIQIWPGSKPNIAAPDFHVHTKSLFWAALSSRWPFIYWMASHTLTIRWRYANSNGNCVSFCGLHTLRTLFCFAIDVVESIIEEVSRTIRDSFENCFVGCWFGSLIWLKTSWRTGKDQQKTGHETMKLGGGVFLFTRNVQEITCRVEIDQCRQADQHLPNEMRGLGKRRTSD